MQDQRYWDGDPAYRAHVHRQFQRVYDSPDNPPQGFRIGPPAIHATTVEPFEPDAPPTLPAKPRLSNAPSEPGRAAGRTRSLLARGATENGTSKADRLDGKRTVGNPGDNLLSGGEETTDKAKRTAPPPDALPVRGRGLLGESDIVELFDPSDDDLEDMRGQIRPVAELEQAQMWLSELTVEKALEFFESAGFDTAHRLLSHYLEGSGRPVTIPTSVVREYGGVESAEEVVIGQFRSWLAGEIMDSRFGRPTLRIGDGETLVIGGDGQTPTSELAHRVRWFESFSGAGDSFRLHEIAEEALWAVGGGTVWGYGYVVLERQGDEIAVSGFIDFRVEDEYDFAKNHPAGLDKLATLGEAAEFEVCSSLWRRRIQATIPLVDGVPQPFDLRVLD